MISRVSRVKFGLTIGSGLGIHIGLGLGITAEKRLCLYLGITIAMALRVCLLAVIMCCAFRYVHLNNWCRF